MNGGEVGKRAVARNDIEFAAELCENMLPSIVGGMQLRPGFEYLTTLANAGNARLIPFLDSDGTGGEVLVFKNGHIAIYDSDGTEHIIADYFWTNDKNDKIQYVQVGDILFLAIPDTQPYQLKRIGEDANLLASWTLEPYLNDVEDGPFRVSRKTTELTISSRSVFDDNAFQITASAPIFKANDVGRLIRGIHYYQRTEQRFNSIDTSRSIRVSGVSPEDSADQNTGRIVFLTLDHATSWTGKAVLERSVGDSPDGAWSVVGEYVAGNTKTFTLKGSGGLANWPAGADGYDPNNKTTSYDWQSNFNCLL